MDAVWYSSIEYVSALMYTLGFSAQGKRAGVVCGSVGREVMVLKKLAGQRDHAAGLSFTQGRCKEGQR